MSKFYYINMIRCISHSFYTIPYLQYAVFLSAKHEFPDLTFLQKSFENEKKNMQKYIF